MIVYLFSILLVVSPVKVTCVKTSVISLNKLTTDVLMGLTLHSLRHTNASLMIACGADIRTVSNRLGHAQTSTTLNLYTHALNSKDIEAAEKLDSILGAKGISS